MSKVTGYLSVIILAYNRRDYILNAVRSVLGQTLDRDLFEIIVIKNFKDDMIDGYLERNSVKNIFSVHQTLGGKISEALDYSIGNIVCLLEDDDRFVKDKLKYVYDTFNKYPYLTYYHNGHCNNTNENDLDKCFKVVSDDCDYWNSIKKLYKRGGGFNLSSMSIKKEFLIKHREKYKSFTYQVDGFISFLVVDNREKFLKDDRKLTVYYYHSSASRNLKDYRAFAEYNLENVQNVLGEKDKMISYLKTVDVQNIFIGDRSFLMIKHCINSGRACNNFFLSFRLLMKYSLSDFKTKAGLTFLYILSRISHRATLKLFYLIEPSYVGNVGN